MDVIYSALFEGDTTRLLPKITSFLVQIFGFLNFLDFFKYLKSLKKNKIAFKVIDSEETSVKVRKKTSFKQRNITMLNARIHV